MIEWETILLYLVGLLGILMLAALLVWALFYLYSYKCDKESDLEEFGEEAEVDPGAIRSYINRRRREEAARGRPGAERGAGPRQTMLSSLHRRAQETDVVVASALSSIPLRELGGPNCEVLVDVGQQMYMNREELEQGEPADGCIVCRTRKEIAWAQVSCYARTTIGVLVYKRPAKQPVLSLKEELGTETRALVAAAASKQAKSQSVSTLSLAPSPDSRISEPQAGQQV